MPENLTQKWLRQNIAQYQARDRLFVDVDGVLQRHPTLRPKSDVYTYDDGRTQLLICIHGLLPITYRQASYNIPVAIWLPMEYPRAPPITYVVPTSDMLVRAGKFLEVSGKCNNEYMQQWSRKNEGCSLLSLIGTLQEDFSRDPPVYSRPKGSVEVPRAASAPNSSATSSNSRPPPPILPPKPGSQVTSRATSPQVPPIQAPLVLRPAPPLPPPINSVPPQYANYGQNVQTPDHVPIHGSEISYRTPYESRWSTSGPHPPLPPSTIPLLAPQSSSSLHSIQPPAPIPDLIDEEPALAEPMEGYSAYAPPPRPPNPELMRLHHMVHQKLTSEILSLSQVLSVDAERLRAQQSDLLAGEPAIRDEMARLEAVRDVCRNVADRLKQTVEHANQNISNLRRKGDPEVDELVCSTTIVHNQLINLIAEDNAIEDTIYHLHRALNAGRIDLERFLRTSRVLAEEQFMKRALIEKIQGLVPIGAQWT